MTHLFTFHLNDTLIATFIRHKVRFLVVGGLAVKFYVPEREVDDLDLLIEQTPENAERLFSAFAELRLLPNFSKDLIASPGQNPQQLPLKHSYYADLLTTGRLLEFESEWQSATVAHVGQNLVRIASRDLLIRQKKESGRDKDLKDVEILERAA